MVFNNPLSIKCIYSLDSLKIKKYYISIFSISVQEVVTEYPDWLRHTTRCTHFVSFFFTIHNHAFGPFCNPRSKNITTQSMFYQLSLNMKFFFKPTLFHVMNDYKYNSSGRCWMAAGRCRIASGKYRMASGRSWKALGRLWMASGWC